MSGPITSVSPGEYHVPVMVRESLELLAVREDGWYVDATLGGGGHSRAILDRLGEDGRLLGLDQDADSLAQAVGWAAPFGQRFVPVRGSFADLRALAGAAGFGAVDGVLFDLGVSSHQLDVPERGFSFRAGGPLDMRMDSRGEMTAADIIGHWSEQEIVDILRRFGEERFAGRIARAIVHDRDRIKSTADLAGVVKRAVPGQGGGDRIHPATRTFQALRIAVNGEMDALAAGLEQALSILKPAGRLVLISYHSLEDRMVKTAFRDWATGCICPPRIPFCQCGHTASVRLVTRRSITPSSEEVAANPRSRSARVRAVEKLAAEKVGEITTNH